MTVVWGPAVRITRANGTEREWTGLACPRCAGITIIETHRALAAIAKIYPENGGDETIIKHVPDRIKKHYDDATKALNAGLPGPAAVELRRTLEGCATEVGIEQKVLARAITEMVSQGLITPEFSKVTQHVRIVGNQGAHFSDEEVTEEQAQRALEFTTQVLRNLFELPGELKLLEEPSAAAAADQTDE